MILALQKPVQIIRPNDAISQYLLISVLFTLFYCLLESAFISSYFHFRF